MISINIVPNIASLSGRRVLTVPCTGEPLRSYIPDELLEKGYRVRLNGAIIDYDLLESTPVPDQSNINIFSPARSDKMFKFPAILVTWPFYPAHLAFKGLGKLFNSFAPQLPSHGSGGNESSATYAWNGIQTTSDVGIPVAVIYGKHRFGGNVINVYTEQIDEKSYLYLLLGIGEGEIESIGGVTKSIYQSKSATMQWVDAEDLSEIIGDRITIDDNPIGDYRAVKVAFRYGEDVQTAIEKFDELHNLRSFNNQLTKNVSQTYTTINDDVDAVVLTFEAPRVIHFEKDGGTKKARVDVKIEYRKYDPTDTEAWTEAGVLTINEASLTTIRREFAIRGLEPGKYQIRLTKTSRDSDTRTTVDIFLRSLDELVSATLTYPRTALLGLRIEATDQLSGSIPNITFEVEGRKIQVWDPDTEEWKTEFSRNPVWCVLDFITNPIYGAGDRVTTTDIDLEDWKAAAAYCDEMVPSFDRTTGESEVVRYQFDAVLDSLSNAYDVITRMCASFLAWPLFADDAIRLVLDKPEIPCDVIGMGNIKKGSFEESFSSISSQVNYSEVQFTDETKRHERDLVIVEDINLVPGSEIIKEAFNGWGITRRSQAIRVARHRILSDRFGARTLRLSGGPDLLRRFPGQVVRVSHIVPGWGVASGRILAAGSNWFSVDDEVEIPVAGAGETWTVIVTHKDDSMEEFEITSPPGRYARGDQITIDGTWASIPQPFDVYSIGDQGTNGKTFRITSMNISSDATVELQLNEYHAEVYSDAEFPADPPNYSTLPHRNALPPPIKNPRAWGGQGYRRSIYLGWEVPERTSTQAYFSHAIIYVSEDGESYRQVGTSDNKMFEFTNIVPGKTYYFKLVSVSTFATKTSLDDAEVVSFTWIPARPPDVHGLQIKGQGNNPIFFEVSPTFTWHEPSIPKTEGNPIWSANLGAGAGYRDLFFKSYRVEIWNTLGQRVRLENVQQPYFTYTIEMNRQDHGGVASREFTITVLVEDLWGQFSQNPAKLTVRSGVIPPVQEVSYLERGKPLVYEDPRFPGGYGVFDFVEKELPYTGITISALGEDRGLIRMAWPEYDAYIRANHPDFAGYRVFRRRIASGETQTPIPLNNGRPSETFFWRNLTEASFEDIGIIEYDIDYRGDRYAAIYYVIIPVNSFGIDGISLFQIKLMLGAVEVFSTW